jgi:hypothetical protein
MDIAKEAARLFSPKPWKHKVPYDICVKCWSQSIKEPCPIPDPIDITDWNIAIQVLRDLCKRGMFNMASIAAHSSTYKPDVSNDLNRSMFWQWVGKEATAEQIFEICVLAKQAERKSNDR